MNDFDEPPDFYDDGDDRDEDDLTQEDFDDDDDLIYDALDGLAYPGPRSDASTWVSADGTATPVRRMRSRHIENVVRLIIRRAAAIKAEHADADEERVRRAFYSYSDGTDADLSDGIEELQRAAAELDGLTERPIDEAIDIVSQDATLQRLLPTWPALVLEARRRGLLGMTATGESAAPGTVNTKSDALRRVETRVEPTRRGW